MRLQINDKQDNVSKLLPLQYTGCGSYFYPEGVFMFSLTLNEKEIELLKKSINHCLKTCKNGSDRDGCNDCAALENVLKRLQ